MSVRGFKSVLMVGAVASAALGCYLVSLRVASERAALESVETKIVLAQRDIRLLETEIGTRGRLAQLERWNVRAIQLSAPTADQFVDNGFQLATLVKPQAKPAIAAPVVLAAAPRDAAPARPRIVSDDSDAPVPSIAPKAPSDMMHVASYTRPVTPVARPEPSTKPARTVATTVSKTLAPKPATKPAKTATADPLAPLPAAAGKAKGAASPRKTTKDLGTP
ncbi:hypothetical protein H9L12_08975 [Sphingomonas rhizophila]|uniref:Uncharacterized protein n=1 Tax=Sphingomonas rhizophila TaxID=2071607 RepID=A0A7G9S9C9_9SPHN|nr:hypothetical protein [Sphingomonas rhizophila]QNN64454.1 hypothetical protein H9L12_08975 [Sphingomonas rhizophila]